MFLLVPAYPSSPGQKAVKQLCVCVCVCVCYPEAAHGWIFTKFGTAIGATNVIICTKFFGDRLRGADSVGGQKLPNLKPVAVNAVLVLLCSV